MTKASPDINNSIKILQTFLGTPMMYWKSGSANDAGETECNRATATVMHRLHHLNLASLVHVGAYVITIHPSSQGEVT
jgi:hypothetical protein